MKSSKPERTETEERRRRLWSIGLVVVIGLVGVGYQVKQAAAFETATAGNDFTCAVNKSSIAYCWGLNTVGQLGTGGDQNRPNPTILNNVRDASSIAAGSTHTCAIRESGQADCWGQNLFGQLGNGQSGPLYSNIPVAVIGLADARAVAAGIYQSCAVRTSGQAACWGNNQFGQIGDGTLTNRSVPTPVQGLNDATTISVGNGHSCAIRGSGQAVCWGYNFFGQLGDGTTIDRLVPTPVPGLTDAKAISASADGTCAIRTTGQVVCWGGNAHGQLGDGTTTARRVPTPVLGLTNISSLSAGPTSTCAVEQGGNAFCWGGNASGQLGDGTTTSRLVPTAVQGVTEARSISVGIDHACLDRTTGQTLCWGNGDVGQIGDGNLFNRLSPTPVNETYELKLTLSGRGKGAVGFDPPGTTCQFDCSDEYPRGTEVNLTATPESGSTFLGWSGACSGAASCRITMDDVREVSANFGKPALGALRVSPKTRSAGRGSKISYAVTVRNAGSAEANGVRVCANANRKQVRVGSCARISSIAAGKSKTVRIGATVRGRAKSGRTKVTIVARGRGLNVRAAKATIRVKS